MEQVCCSTRKIKSNSSLIDGIIAAGGPNKVGANIRAVKLLRIDEKGYPIVRTFKYDYRKRISDEQNPMLFDGDTIVVNQSIYGKTAQAINAVSSPLSGFVQVWTLLKLIND